MLREPARKPLLLPALLDHPLLVSTRLGKQVLRCSWECSFLEKSQLRGEKRRQPAAAAGPMAVMCRSRGQLQSTRHVGGVTCLCLTSLLSTRGVTREECGQA